ncbi:hypothetical protein EYS10_06300 [Rahnella aquatilis]|nr:hypothetical protein EYS10_06300 [Rahnella aquatilis]
MMLIDPYVFLPAKGLDYSKQRLIEVKANLKKILNINRTFNCGIIVDQAQWKYIERTYIKKLTQLFNDGDLNTALLSLRRVIKTVDMSTTVHIRAWGIKPLFYNLASKEDIDFGDSLARSAFYCISNYKQAYLFIEEIDGRNIKTHTVGHSKITERLRWRIYISSTGLNGAVPIACISSMRNIQVPWTTRYDILLPDTGEYSFTPPVKWYLRNTDSVITRQSKPVFLDISDNGWANPNTPGGAYHWDVYLKDQKWIDSRGADQINVTRYGVTQPEGTPGTIHHVPTGKANLAKNK